MAKGPPGIAICELCIAEAGVIPVKTDAALTCSFCGLAERPSRFSFRDRKIVLATAKGDVRICSQCLKIVRSILKHQAVVGGRDQTSPPLER